MKHLLSKLSELLTLPTRAIQLLLKNQAVDELTKLLVRFIQALGLNLDDTIIAEPVLMPGDCSMTFRGGHNYLILEDDTIVYEYKTGPYLGQEFDKVFLNNNI